jgi:hypothetical protein
LCALALGACSDPDLGNSQSRSSAESPSSTVLAVSPANKKPDVLTWRDSNGNPVHVVGTEMNMVDFLIATDDGEVWHYTTYSGQVTAVASGLSVYYSGPNCTGSTFMDRRFAPRSTISTPTQDDLGEEVRVVPDAPVFQTVTYNSTGVGSNCQTNGPNSLLLTTFSGLRQVAIPSSLGSVPFHPEFVRIDDD